MCDINRKCDKGIYGWTGHLQINDVELGEVIMHMIFTNMKTYISSQFSSFFCPIAFLNHLFGHRQTHSALDTSDFKHSSKV